MSALKDCELSINRQYGERDVVRIEAKSDGRRPPVKEPREKPKPTKASTRDAKRKKRGKHLFRV